MQTEHMYFSSLQINRLEKEEPKKRLKITLTVAKKMRIKWDIKTGNSV